MTTKTELNRIVNRSKPSGNGAFRVRPEDVTTNRKAANRRAADRRDRDSKAASKRKRIERQKELGSDSPMSVDEFDKAVDFVHEEFGIVLESNWDGYSVRPRLTERELFALCAAVEEGTTYRDRVVAVRRLSRLGFRVSFTETGPRPGALR